MNETISTDCRRAVIGPVFFLSVCAVPFILAAGCMNELYKALFYSETGILPAGSHWTMLWTGLSSDAMVFVVPILAAVPYTAAYLDDIQSGYIKAALPRSGAGRYILGKLAACALSGGLVQVCGIVLSAGLSFLLISPKEYADPAGFFPPGTLPQLLDSCVCFFCAGALYAVFGLAVSAFTESRYLAYTAPFILQYFLIILRVRYFKTVYVLDPREWLSPSAAWPLGSAGPVILMAELLLLCSAAFAAAASRRLGSL